MAYFFPLRKAMLGWNKSLSFFSSERVAAVTQGKYSINIAFAVLVF